MKTLQHDLHLRYEAYTRAHQRFAERGVFTRIYTSSSTHRFTFV